MPEGEVVGLGGQTFEWLFAPTEVHALAEQSTFRLDFEKEMSATTATGHRLWSANRVNQTKTAKMTYTYLKRDEILLTYKYKIGLFLYIY